MTTLLIDGDIVAYRSALSAQSDMVFGDRTISAADPDVAKAKCRDLVETAMSKFDVDDASNVILCMSDERNFRMEVSPTYKQFRVALAKPILLGEMKQYIDETYRTCKKPGLEGDDVMGILATHPKLIKGRRIMVSIDKDMKTVPGVIWNPRRDTVEEISEEQADYWHLFQTLTGDRVDGYPGCPGIGKAKAAKLLDAVRPGKRSLWWAQVEQTFLNKGLTEDDALVQARLARILRWTDYDYTKKEPKLWSPTK